MVVFDRKLESNDLILYFFELPEGKKSSSIVSHQFPLLQMMKTPGIQGKQSSNGIVAIQDLAFYPWVDMFFTLYGRYRTFRQFPKDHLSFISCQRPDLELGNVYFRNSSSPSLLFRSTEGRSQAISDMLRSRWRSYFFLNRGRSSRATIWWWSQLLEWSELLSRPSGKKTSAEKCKFPGTT